MLRHQKHAQKARHDFCCYQFHMRPSNCSIVSSTNCFLARSCLVCTQFCYITLRIVTQCHKLDFRPAYLKSTHQELSNEVQLVHIEQIELPNLNRKANIPLTQVALHTTHILIKVLIQWVQLTYFCWHRILDKSLHSFNHLLRFVHFDEHVFSFISCHLVLNLRCELWELFWCTHVQGSIHTIYQLKQAIYNTDCQE